MTLLVDLEFVFVDGEDQIRLLADAAPPPRDPDFVSLSRAVGRARALARTYSDAMSSGVTLRWHAVYFTFTAVPLAICSTVPVYVGLLAAWAMPGRVRFPYESALQVGAICLAAALTIGLVSTLAVAFRRRRQVAGACARRGQGAAPAAVFPADCRVDRAWRRTRGALFLSRDALEFVATDPRDAAVDACFPLAEIDAVEPVHDWLRALESAFDVEGAVSIRRGTDAITLHLAGCRGVLDGALLPAWVQATDAARGSS